MFIHSKFDVWSNFVGGKYQNLTIYARQTSSPFRRSIFKDWAGSGVSWKLWRNLKSRQRGNILSELWTGWNLGNKTRLEIATRLIFSYTATL